MDAQVWEKAYLKRIDAQRVTELGWHRRFRSLTVMVIAIGRAAPMIGSAVAFVVYSRFHTLSADRVLPALSVFQSLRLPFILIPLIGALAASTSVSLGRVGRYLLLPSQPVRPMDNVEQMDAPEPTQPGASPLLRVEAASIGWPCKPPGAAKDAAGPPAGSGGLTVEASSASKSGPPDNAASDIDAILTANFAVHGGELVAVVGPVSSGKSTLLSALWGEALVASGCVSGPKSLGVVPQRPFTLAGTLADNILMGRPRDAAILDRVLADCAMEQDLEKLPLRLETEVGERGVTLSGGQQQRLALARAIYSQPALLLLDDPLSAVDARTQLLLMRSLTSFIHGSGKQRAAIVSVNQMHLLRHFDRVIVLDSGVVTHDCSAAEYMRVAGLEARDAAAEQTIDDVALTWSPMPKKGSEARVEVETAAAAQGALGGEDPELTEAEGGQAAVMPLPSGASTAGSEPSALVVAERKRDGTFGSGLMIKYLKAMGWGWTTAYFVLLVATFSAVGVTDWVLSLWTRRPSDSGFYLSWFSSLAGAQLVIMLSCSLTWSFGSIHASRNVHHDTITRLIHAPLSWFEANPSGRVMSRFTSDLGVVDMQIWTDLDTVFQLSGFLVVSVLLVAVQSGGTLAVPGGLYLLLLYALLDVADRSAREVKRLANNSQSPILSTLNEMKQGAALVRALHLESFLATRMRGCVARWSGLSFQHKALNTWGTNISSLAACLLTLGAGLYFVATRGSNHGSLSALGLTYAGVIPYFTAIVTSLYSNMRQSMTGLDRLLEYLQLPQEAERHLPTDPPVGGANSAQSDHGVLWPSAGRIDFDGVSVRYRPGLPLALDSFTATIRAKERVGVVGRTGAGKSSLMLALFRLVDIEAGSICIDGRSTTGLGLDACRRCVSIIPQEPVLYKGTVSHNLDPFDTTTEEERRVAISRARLPPQMLDVQVSKGGINISAGERQLLCFARAILQPRPILVLDEATSNLDAASDAAMQHLLRSEFASVTLLTIAHRLLTVIDYDSILVMGGGKLLEHAAPEELLSRAGGVLHGLAKALGQDAFDELLAKAQDVPSRV